MTSGVTSKFAEVYEAAVYRAGDYAFTLSARPTGVTLFGGRPFVLVTAYNPHSNPLPDAENRRRNRTLEKELRARGLSFAPSSGASPDGVWWEPGFAVFGLSSGEALALGRQHGQHAVVWGEGERVALAWCDDGRLESFYPLLVNEPEAKSPDIKGSDMKSEVPA